MGELKEPKATLGNSHVQSNLGSWKAADWTADSRADAKGAQVSMLSMRCHWHKSSRDAGGGVFDSCTLIHPASPSCRQGLSDQIAPACGPELWVPTGSEEVGRRALLGDQASGRSEHGQPKAMGRHTIDF